MAKQRGKASKSKPVTQHQLFPAVVALWFGALFGLGSLAVRTGLIEALVIKSKIDLLVSAAAPPLGMTARMLIALVMAALGAMIGASLARRIARPRQEARERKRTNLSTRDEGAAAGPFEGFSDASTRNPAPAEDSAATADTPGLPANRRRALAIEHDEGEFVPHDMAPLPGGTPQIFDIASAGLSNAPAEAESFARPPEQSPTELVTAPIPAPVSLDWGNAAPLLPPAAGPAPIPAPQAIEAQLQVFHPVEPAPVSSFEAPLPEPTDGRQVFGVAASATPPTDQPRQIFGAPVINDHVPKEFIEAQGFRTSVFEAPEPSPLFPPRFEAAAVAPEPVEAPQPAPIPEAYVPPAEVTSSAHVEELAAPAIVVSPEPVLPSPASLGIEDLSARLAESMRRRRAGRAAAAAETAPEPVAPAAIAQPEVVETPAPAPVPQAYEPAPGAVPAFSVPPFAVPDFTVPAAPEPTEAVSALAPAVAAPVPQPVPAALRPLDLTGFEEEDRAEHDLQLPPRRITLPVEPAPAPALPEAFAPPVAAPADDEPDTAEQAAVAEENYASLLGVTPSPASLRNPFVRVDEPEDETEAVEPVVIFPGQAVPALQPFAAPSLATEEATSFRRFDAPSSAGQGQPIAANETANAMPSEEAERALRAALANLQRMSGAA